MCYGPVTCKPHYVKLTTGGAVKLTWADETANARTEISDEIQET
jgi:hypothetical protein